MNERVANAGVRVAGFSVAVEPRPDLSKNRLLKRLREIGNPVLAETDSGFLLVDEEAEQGELVWACDRCGAYSRSQAVCEEHERKCDG